MRLFLEPGFGHCGTPAMTRPLCPYPKQARYSGQGDIYDARNFACAQL